MYIFEQYLKKVIDFDSLIKLERKLQNRGFAVEESVYSIIKGVQWADFQSQTSKVENTITIL